MKNKADLTFGGKLKGKFNVIEERDFDVLFTIEGDTGKVTTMSILIDKKKQDMITFDYQDLKEIIEGNINE